MTDDSDGELVSQAAHRSSWSQGQGRGRSRHRRLAGEPRCYNRDDSSLRCDWIQRMQSSARVGEPVSDFDADAGAGGKDARFVMRQSGHLRANQPRWTGQHHKATIHIGITMSSWTETSKNQW